MRKTAFYRFTSLLLAALVSAAACDILFGPSDETPAQIEQEISKLVNDHRRSIGESELVWNDTIAEQARLHSQSMADGMVPFGHDGYETRFALIGKTIPWDKASEIIALAGSAADAVNAWLASPEHKTNIEDNFDLTGVGVAKDKSGSSFYATQIFIKPK
jgi:uncharacterized protein YkwD